MTTPTVTPPIRPSRRSPPRHSRADPVWIVGIIVGAIFVAMALLLVGCEGVASAQSITPVRQSKLPWKTVLSNVTGTQTSSVIFDTSSFASAQVAFYSNVSGCTEVYTWEVAPLSPFVRIGTAATASDITVSVNGAQNAVGAFNTNHLGQSVNQTRLLLQSGLDGSTACTYSIDVALVPFSSASIIAGPLGIGEQYGSNSAVMPVPVGGAYTLAEVGLYSEALRGDRESGALWVGQQPLAAATNASPASVSSVTATSVFTFTYARGCITASNVGTVTLWCNVASTANASATVYQFPLNSSGTANVRGDTFTSPQRYTFGQIFSCLAASGTGSIAFAGHTCH